MTFPVGITLKTEGSAQAASALESVAAEIKRVGEQAQVAGNALQSGITEQLERVQQNAVGLNNATTKAAGGFGNLRGMAQQVGWQLQDVAVQAQMGTNAIVIMTQQGSQLIGAFNPLAGAAIAVGGALIGALLPSLFNTGKAAEEMANKAKILTKNLRDFSDVQQGIINKATGYSIEAKTKEYADLTK